MKALAGGVVIAVTCISEFSGSPLRLSTKSSVSSGLPIRV